MNNVLIFNTEKETYSSEQITVLRTLRNEALESYHSICSLFEELAIENTNTKTRLRESVRLAAEEARKSQNLYQHAQRNRRAIKNGDNLLNLELLNGN